MCCFVLPSSTFTPTPTPSSCPMSLLASCTWPTSPIPGIHAVGNTTTHLPTIVTSRRTLPHLHINPCHILCRQSVFSQQQQQQKVDIPSFWLKNKSHKQNKKSIFKKNRKNTTWRIWFVETFWITVKLEVKEKATYQKSSPLLGCERNWRTKN